MKKLFLLTLAVIVYSTVAQGGIDFVGVDDVATTYDSGSETLSMVDTAVITVEYDDNTQFSIDPGSFSLISYYDSGMLFTGGTFVFTDESGPPSVILSGNVLGRNERGEGYKVTLGAIHQQGRILWFLLR